MMEGYRCVFGGSGADYSSSGTPDVTAGTPKLNDAAEVTATHPPSMNDGHLTPAPPKVLSLYLHHLGRIG